MHQQNAKGKMLEWLKRHAWKACNRLKRFGGSNPPLSAKQVFMQLAILCKIAISAKLNIFKSPSSTIKATYKNDARFFPRNLSHGKIYCFLLTCKTQTLAIDPLMG